MHEKIFFQDYDGQDVPKTVSVTLYAWAFLNSGSVAPTTEGRALPCFGIFIEVFPITEFYVVTMLKCDFVSFHTK